MTVRRIPLDPPWLLVPILAGLVLGMASVSIESWTIGVTYLGIVLVGVPAAFGVDRWLARNRPR